MCESVPTTVSGERDPVAVGDDRGEELEVDLVDDPGPGRHDPQVAERGLRPAQELVALAVALVLALDIEGERAARPELVDLDRVVDDEVGGDERVDEGGVATEVGHRVAHDREVDDRGDAGEVLEEHPGRHERDLGLGRLARPPREQGLDILGADHRPAGVAEEVLEQDLDRDRQRREIDPAGHGVEPVEVRQPCAETGARAEGIGEWVRGRHAAPPSSTAQLRGVSRRRAGAPAPGRSSRPVYGDWPRVTRRHKGGGYTRRVPTRRDRRDPAMTAARAR